MLDPNAPKSGFIAVEPRPTDWHAAGETGVVSLVNYNSDWRPFLPVGEWQRDLNANPPFETDACVSFSADQVLQTYGNFCLQTDLYPADSVKWLQDNGYIVDGKLNFSDRFTAKMSNTTTNGNSMPTVLDSIRANGLVPEALWPFPFQEVENAPQNAWNTYYGPIPANVIQLGLDFKSRFQVAYDWVAYPEAPLTSAQFQAALRQSPLQIATAVCPPWNTDQVLQACGAGAAHATMMVDVEQWYDIFDHYVPFQKKFALDYTITYAIRAVLNPVSNMPPPPFHYIFTKDLHFQGTNNDPRELLNLQTALQSLKGKNGQPYMQRGVYGPFGGLTRDALAKFQVDHGIADIPQGNDFGPRSRSEMNTALHLQS